MILIWPYGHWILHGHLQDGILGTLFDLLDSLFYKFILFLLHLNTGMVEWNVNSSVLIKFEKYAKEEKYKNNQVTFMV